jgi:O-antigen/teichoic acid export membrane protein
VARVRGSRLLTQSLTYAVSNGTAGLLAAATAALIARHLSRGDYGSFSFAISFLPLMALFFELGLFLPMSRLAALATGRTKRAVEGAAIATFVPIALAFSLLVVGFSFVVDPIFHVHVASAFRIAAPVALVYPFAQFSVLLAQGDGRLHLYSLWTLCGQIIYLILVVAAISTVGLHQPAVPLLLRGAALTAGAIGLLVSLSPVFEGVRDHVAEFVRQARDWGLKAFVGRVLSIGTYNMDVLMLAAFTQARTVALYAVAGNLAIGCGLPITGLSSAIFAPLVHRDRLDRRWLAVAWGFGLVVVLALWLLGGTVIDVIFSKRYAGAAVLLVALALAQAVRGVTSIYNSFLGAHGMGDELRRASVVLTLANVIFNVGLIPPFGALGAAWASFLALVINLGAHIHYYRRASPTPEASPAERTA